MEVTVKTETPEDELNLNPLKRQLQSPFRETPAKKFKATPAKKNAIMILNELKPKLIYEIIGTGPAHLRTFTATVTIDDQVYKATGLSKKTAKASVAQLALKSTYAQFFKPEEILLSPLEHQSLETPDFSHDAVIIPDENSFFYKELKTINQQPPKQAPTPAHVTPLYFLNKKRPGLTYEVIKEEGKSHAKKFTVQVMVDGEPFQGSGPSKKQAKSAAAQAALKKIFSWEVVSKLIPPHQKPSDQEPAEEFADYLARLVETAYQKLAHDKPDAVNRYKVLAGIAMTREPSNEGVVISVATGSKCVSGGYLSIVGEIVNDCHAEILARRCLVDFFYDQVELHRREPQSSIFHDQVNSEGRLVLRPGTRFHLYVSSSPCGDARIFTLTDKEPEAGRDPHPHRLGRGVLRTKIESGEGTVPVAGTCIQTWDGIIQGERLLTMSCSDKMARWNVVGLQGSILTHLMDPVYLETIVVGSLFHRTHLHRAIVGRMEHVQGLPHPFRLTRPVLVGTSTPPDRLAIKAPRYSTCWAAGWKEMEIVDPTKGRLCDGSVSRISKNRLFRRFLHFVSTDFDWRTRLSYCIGSSHLVAYGQVKSTASGFIDAKNRMEQALNTVRLGCWIKKPIEQDLFELSLSQLIEPSQLDIEQNPKNE